MLLGEDFYSSILRVKYKRNNKSDKNIFIKEKKLVKNN